MVAVAVAVAAAHGAAAHGGAEICDAQFFFGYLLFGVFFDYAIIISFKAVGVALIITVKSS